MEFSLTSVQQQWVEKAQRVAKECLEPRASHYDEAGTHPVDSWRDLWKNGLLAIGVPEKYGGAELDMLTYVIVIENLAKGCTSTSMTLHMHSVVQRYISALATHEQKLKFYPDVVAHGRMYGSWGSEPEGRGGTGIRATTITPKDGGYVINGDKHFCTMAGATERAMVHCTLEGYEDHEGYTLALVPFGTAGMEIVGEWNPLGMRATVSPSVSFNNCFVSEDSVIGTRGQGNRVGVGQGFGLGYAAVYLGAAQSALEFAVDYVKTHQFAPDPEPLSHSPLVQRTIAEMAMALDSARLILYQSASQWEDTKPLDRWILAARAKYLASEAALMTSNKAIQTVGGRSAHKHYPLERIYRDIRTCTLMPPNLERALGLIGKNALDVVDETSAARAAS